MGSKVGIANKPINHNLVGEDADDNDAIISSSTFNASKPPSNLDINFSVDQKMARNNNSNSSNNNHHNNNRDDAENDFGKVTVQPNNFINLDSLKPNIDVKALTDIFNSYATKKTFATGFFNLALVATNFAQMKSLISPTQGRTTVWNALNIVLMTFIVVSLFLQIIVGVLLVFLAKQGEFIDEEKRNQLIRSNNGTTLLVVAISIINIFINVFISI